MLSGCRSLARPLQSIIASVVKKNTEIYLRGDYTEDTIWKRRTKYTTEELIEGVNALGVLYFFASSTSTIHSIVFSTYHKHKTWTIKAWDYVRLKNETRKGSGGQEKIITERNGAGGDGREVVEDQCP